MCNFNVAVREWNEQIIFLRKIIPGGADKSYGIQVARLAGVAKGNSGSREETFSSISKSQTARPKRRKRRKGKRSEEAHATAQEQAADGFAMIRQDRTTMPVKTEKELSEQLRSHWLKAVAAIELRNFGYAISLLAGNPEAGAGVSDRAAIVAPRRSDEAEVGEESVLQWSRPRRSRS